jgi:hypothetical protein
MRIPKKHRVVLAALVISGLALAAGLNARQVRTAQRQKAKTNPVEAFSELRTDLDKLVESHRNISAAVKEIQDLYTGFNEKIQEVSGMARRAEKTLPYLRTQAGGEANVRLIRAAKEMQEMHRNLTLQLLRLQSKMEQENRQFTMISSAMKVKHDTAKAAIRNIR